MTNSADQNSVGLKPIDEDGKFSQEVESDPYVKRVRSALRESIDEMRRSIELSSLGIDGYKLVDPRWDHLIFYIRCSNFSNDPSITKLVVKFLIEHFNMHLAEHSVRYDEKDFEFHDSVGNYWLWEVHKEPGA